MNPPVLSKKDLLGSLPDEWPRDLLPDIQDRVRADRQKVVVLDDDPTGTQTVHGIPVLTGWSVDALAKELEARHPAFYVLTNTRSMTAREACRLNRQIGANLKTAVERTGVDPRVISRSDSTLRGHFPDEVDALAEALGTGPRPCLLAPCFFEGRRYTIDDVHYVAEKDVMVPAAETAYARDAAFGYRHSNLKMWVEEKTRGRVRRDQVAAIALETIRRGGPERVKKIVLALKPGSVCVVNAASYRDLEVVVLGLLKAENRGRRLLFRTAASFVRVCCGLAKRPLLAACDLGMGSQKGGLFVVGSHVPKTTRQVEALMNVSRVAAIEINAKRLLDPGQAPTEISRAAKALNQALGQGRDTVLYTSRDLVSGRDRAHNLAIGRQVSGGLIRIVSALKHRPRYLVAKGGITASDIATASLGIRRAMILGQILPGVPVWALGAETPYPGMAYIVFPGNVGSRNALLEIRSNLAVESEQYGDQSH